MWVLFGLHNIRQIYIILIYFHRLIKRLPTIIHNLGILLQIYGIYVTLTLERDKTFNR